MICFIFIRVFVCVCTVLLGRHFAAFSFCLTCKQCTFAQRPDMTRTEIKIISFDLSLCVSLHFISSYLWVICMRIDFQMNRFSTISWFSLRLLSAVPSTKDKLNIYRTFVSMCVGVRQTTCLASVRIEDTTYNE